MPCVCICVYVYMYIPSINIPRLSPAEIRRDCDPRNLIYSHVTDNKDTRLVDSELNTCAVISIVAICDTRISLRLRAKRRNHIYCTFIAEITMKLALGVSAIIFLAYFFSYFYRAKNLFSTRSQCVSCPLGTSVLTLHYQKKTLTRLLLFFVLHSLRAMRRAILRPLRFNTLVLSRLHVQVKPSLL